MRMDVARISADIQGGEELYRRALQRVEGLMGQVEKAEVDFSVLNRLEPENRRLKARLRTAQGELEGNKDKLSFCLLYTSPSPRDGLLSRMPSSA